MKVTMMDNPGKADDVIRRETAINTVSEKEGWYPASLWYVPPAETASEIWDAADPESANVIIENMIEHAMNWSTIAEIVSCIAPLCDELSPKGAIKVLKQLVICRDCRHRLDLHYEKEGEKPYIKCICESKYGLKKPYQVSPVDFCSRGERNENDSFIERT